MSQKEMILQHLKRGNELTPLTALKMFGCFRLASVIHILKSEGHDISTTIVGDKKRFASYKLQTRCVNNQVEMAI